MHKTASILLFWIVGATLIFSVLGTSVIVGVVNAEDSAQQAYLVFDKNCFDCHGNLGDFKDKLLIEAYDSLIQSGSVTPGQPDASELYKRLLGPTENGGQMPPPGLPPLTNEAIESIRVWIENGASDWNVVDDNRSSIGPKRILETIQHHIETRVSNPAFARYFSTTHLYDAGIPTERLQSHSLALSKLVNSLSWGADIVKP